MLRCFFGSKKDKASKKKPSLKKQQKQKRGNNNSNDNDEPVPTLTVSLRRQLLSETFRTACKDLGRLASRTTVIAVPSVHGAAAVTGACDAFLLETPPTPPILGDEAAAAAAATKTATTTTATPAGATEVPPASDVAEMVAPTTTAAESVLRLLTALVAAVEGRDRLAAVQPEVERILAGHTAVDELKAEHLFRVLGETSPTARVLRLVSQTVVMEATYLVRMALPGLPLCRDLRERRGWQVYIHAAPDGIRVTHARVELGGSPQDGPAAQFELAWRVQATLAPDASALEGAELWVDSLTCGDGMPVDSVAALTRLVLPAGQPWALAS